MEPLCSPPVRWERQEWAESHCDVEVDPLLLVIADQHRLDAHVGDVDGAREEEEDGQAAQQQAQQHRRSDVQLPAGGARFLSSQVLTPWTVFSQ